MAQQSGGARRTIGWVLDRNDRAELLKRVPRVYAETVAHHVTLKSNAAPGDRVPAAEDPAVVGLADDGRGIQALVVRIGGTTDRPGGGTYHITWSLAPGHRAVESNDVIAAHGWTPFDPTAIRLHPGEL